ncbi:MAG: hypothetical protein MK118_11740, partial [Dehalococcoidia bacterium]|nr:hypothetical protein [Dehalococcoidia bacterium]
MRKLQKFTLPALIGIFLLILAACGGDDESDTTSAPAATSAPVAVATTGASFEFQYVCVNRTLLPCQVIQEFIDSVEERTDGQIEIQISSYPELGISGFDMIR